MNCGIEVRTVNGELQITDKFKNLSLTRKIKLDALSHEGGKYSVNSHGKINATWYHLGKLLSNEYAVAIACTCNEIVDKIAFAYIAGQDQGTYNFAVADGADISNVEIYIFGFDGDSAIGSYGLQVYDSSGKCVFDSNKNYMKVKACNIEFSTINFTNGIQVPVTEQNIRYGFVACPARNWEAPNGEEQLVSCFLYFRNDGYNNIECMLQQPDGLLTNSTVLKVPYMIIDVSNL